MIASRRTPAEARVLQIAGERPKRRSKITHDLRHNPRLLLCRRDHDHRPSPPRTGEPSAVRPMGYRRLDDEIGLGDGGFIVAPERLMPLHQQPAQPLQVTGSECLPQPPGYVPSR